MVCARWTPDQGTWSAMSTRQFCVRKAESWGVAGQEGGEGMRVASRQSQTKTKIPSVLFLLRIQAPPEESPLARHLLPLLLVPANLGSVQLLGVSDGVGEML